tara:strand:+ start:1059 stop:1580 length:522 start_codon:yes stop_codon:yes gene_type:complete
MSTLKVGTIQDHANSNNALVINNLGIVTTPARPAFRVCPAGDKAISNNTTTVIPFDTKSGNSELFDTQGNFSTGNYRYTPQVAGYYSLSMGVLLKSANYCIGTIQKNGVSQFTNRAWSEGGLYSTAQVNGVIYLNGSSDYVDATVYHNVGSTQNIRGLDAGLGHTYFCGYLIG